MIISYLACVRSDLTIDLAVLMRNAHGKARSERAKDAAAGYPRPYASNFREALTELWSAARCFIEIERIKRASEARQFPLTRVETIEREIALLPYREDYRAAQAKRRELESELAAAN